MLFTSICDDLVKQSYSVQHSAIPEKLIKQLCDRVKSDNTGPIYSTAGIGRSSDHHQNQNVRCDEISWMDDEIPTDKKWTEWTEALRTALNRQLFMGLTFIESHYARYQEGGFYRKHVDAFTGDNNRKVSIVLFLNDDWKAADKGELRLFVGPEHDQEILVMPRLGTLAVFLSDEVPHEVLPTNCTRNSIAGWYR